MKFGTTAMLAAAAVLMTAAPALADDWDFILANQTGKAIKAIAIAPAGSGAFKPDSAYAEEPGKSAMKAGARTTIHFTKDKGCKYDLQATFGDDTTAVWSGFDACEDAYLTISLTDGKPTFKGE